MSDQEQENPEISYCPGTDPEQDISILVDLKEVDPEFMFYEYNITSHQVIADMIDRTSRSEEKLILYGFINRKNPDLFTKKAISARFFDRNTNICIIYKSNYLVLDIRNYKKTYNISWVHEQIINSKKSCVICNKFVLYDPADICEKCGCKICAVCYLKMNNKNHEYFRCIECENIIKVRDIILTKKEVDQMSKFKYWKTKKELLENIMM